MAFVWNTLMVLVFFGALFGGFACLLAAIFFYDGTPPSWVAYWALLGVPAALLAGQMVVKEPRS